MKKILILCLATFSCTCLKSETFTWSDPTTISSGSVNASNPQIVNDTSGNAVAVWIENGSLFAKTKAYGGSWGGATTLSSSGFASDPAMVIDSAGSATVVWDDNGIITTNSYVSGSWGGSSTSLSSSGASSPQLAVDASKNLVAVWARGSNIESATKLFGGSWSVSSDVITSSSPAYPYVAIGGTQVVAVWYGTSGGISTIYSASKAISGSWSAEQAISTGSVNSIYPKIAVDSNENAIAIWYRYTLTSGSYSDVFLQSASFPSGGSWSTPVDIDTTGGVQNPANLIANIGIDSNGNAIAVWSNSPMGNSFNLSATLKPFNNSWSTSPFYLASNNQYSFASSLIVTPSGVTWVANMFYDGVSSININATETNTSAFIPNFWSGPVLISSGVTNGLPCIIANLNGTTLYVEALWVNYDGSISNIESTSGTQNVIQPPGTPSITPGSTNYGFYTNYYNTVEWTTSPSAQVIGYNVFRNNQLLAQVNDAVLQFVDNNRTPGESLTYGVSALDVESQQSSISSNTAIYP